tara:strand:+ start:1122 stop:1805 length:684 start_codon:yes stop_codon:yes gene_type:complete
MTQKRILLVEADNVLRESLSEQLNMHEEFQTTPASSFRDALENVRERHYDLILLDIGLPSVDGCEIYRMIRSVGNKSPIIVLADAPSDWDVLLGSGSGANDYLIKPFRMGVLVARMRAQLRQHEQSEDAAFTIGPYLFQPSARLLTEEQAQRKVRLTEKETSILKYLYQADSKVVSRDTLLSEVWGYNTGVTTHTLETHIYRLRQKIECNPAEAQILVTRPGGYQLV